MKYRIDVLRKYIPIGELPAENCTIRYDATAEIKRGASITCNMDMMHLTVPDFSMVSDRISPVVIDDDGVEHREGIYMIISNPQTFGEAQDQTTLELYDESYILAQSAFDSRHYYAAGTLYTDIFRGILSESGIVRQYIDASAAVTQVDREFAVGDNVLQSLNTLLVEAGFDTLHLDGNGYAKCTLKTDKTAPEFIYKTGTDSEVYPDMTRKKDIYGLPNVFVGVVSTPDQEVLTYKAENHNLNSDLSIERRGYKLTQVYQLDGIASQDELEAYVNKLMTDSMMAIEGVTLSTGIQPDHDFQNCIQIEHKGVTGLYIEKSWSYSLEPGGAMEHYAEKKVFV
jgi:hypothetical protein